MMKPNRRTHSESSIAPNLTHAVAGGIAWLGDSRLAGEARIRIAFTERSGGVSEPPFNSLDLAAHVGDDPASVDENRSRMMRALGLEHLRSRIVTAEQVHGTQVARIAGEHAGVGAFATGQDPVSGTDVLVTGEVDIPLLMLYADCVPVIVVAEKPRPAVAVVHSGWRGTLDGVVSGAIDEVTRLSGADASSLLGYIGPHIGACCYEVDEALISQFRNRFDTITAVDGRLDLEAAVIESMECSGMRRSNIATSGLCTRDLTDRFFSYRAHQVTGRHGALAVITKVD